jgi:hypothetical protein
MRDELAANVRASTPTPSVYDWRSTAANDVLETGNQERLEAPLFPADFGDVAQRILYFPAMFNLRPDGEPLFQCPGYDSDVGARAKYYSCKKYFTKINPQKFGDFFFGFN